MLAADIDLTALAGLEVVDSAGERLGRVRQVYPDAEGRGWVAVRGNLLGTTEVLVPLDDAVLEEDALGVPVSRARFLTAPRRPADTALDAAERRDLRAFYAGASASLPAAREPVAAPEPAAAPESAAASAEVAASAVPAAVSDAPTEMTAFSERLRVDTERVPRTRVRLKKVVVTEQRTVTVPVRREEVRLVREPIEAGDVVPGGAVGPAEQELVLHEERVVVTTEVVPVERVRLLREEVTEDREVTADVRRERIDLEDGPTG